MKLTKNFVHNSIIILLFLPTLMYAASGIHPSIISYLLSDSNSKLIANAGIDQYVHTTHEIYISGSNSQGTNLNYQWIIIQKPDQSTASLVDSTAENTTFIADIDGIYILNLVVSDGETSSETDELRIVASSTNTPPVAIIDSELNIITNTATTIDGSRSYDPDFNAISYYWRVEYLTLFGFRSVPLENTTSKELTFIPEMNTSYYVTLYVNDGLVTVPTTMIVTGNTPPTVDAGLDQDIYTLDTTGVTASVTDPNDSEFTYSWRFLSKPASSLATLSNAAIYNPTFVADIVGTYALEVEVSDGIHSDTDTIYIGATQREQVAPVANAGVDKLVETGEKIYLSGSNSTDLNKDPLTYQWNWVSKPFGSQTGLFSSTTSSPYFTPDIAGEYHFSLVVNDGTVDSAVDTVIITANTTPIADAGTSKRAQINTEYTLNGSLSSDEDNNTLTYSWEIISQPSGIQSSLLNAQDMNSTFTPSNYGDYEFGLTVNDGRTESSVSNVTITVSRFDLLEGDILKSFTDGRMWKTASATTWPQARDYCANLDFGGYTDWSLPSVSVSRWTELSYVKSGNYFTSYYSTVGSTAGTSFFPYYANLDTAGNPVIIESAISFTFVGDEFYGGPIYEVVCTRID